MLLERDVQRLVTHLVQAGSAEVELLGATVILQLLGSDNKLLVSTEIFSGMDYVPPSVRQALGEDLPIPVAATIRTFPKIDEPSATVHLHCLSILSGVDSVQLKALLEEFAWLADEWRRHLNDRGRDDLIRVYNQ